MTVFLNMADKVFFGKGFKERRLTLLILTLLDSGSEDS